MAGIAKRPLRDTLANSYVAAIAIVVLLLRSIDAGVRGLGRPLFHVIDFLVNVIAIGGIPYGSGTFTLGEWLTFIPSIAYLFTALITLLAAYVLSRWVYGAGPFRSLSDCHAKFARTNNV